MKTNIMISNSNMQPSSLRNRKQTVKSFNVVIKLSLATVQPLIGQIAKHENQFGLEQSHGGLKCPMHLPLPSELIEPVPLSRAQQMGVCQYHDTNAAFVGFWNCGVFILGV